MTNEQKANEICARHIFDSNHFDCCMEMRKWKDEENTEFLLKIKNALESMTQTCDKLTSGNIAHERAHLKGYAKGLAELIGKYLKNMKEE